ncbi:hypothetical protein C2W62_34215 [Candidatus Entotheonella serta]|nr:hypothetical protein C2W62_34215 [Candidatus Entotheonella serta]
MAEHFTGSVEIQDLAGAPTIRLHGGTGDIRVGENGKHGNVILSNNDGHQTIRLHGGTGDVFMGDNGEAGTVTVRSSAGKQTIQLSGHSGLIELGGNETDGDVSLLNTDGDETIHLSGNSGNIALGGHGADGDVIVKNSAGDETIRLDGGSGDISLSGADCAEDFDVIGASEALEPGTVMVLDQGIALRPSTKAYDKKAAGVISGAGDFRPGLVLDKRASSTHRAPVALMGKVYCKVDAQYGAIEIGDLLTTSPTPSYAMKANDPLRAFGAVIGKALSTLPEGTGMIPILVKLQ